MTVSEISGELWQVEPAGRTEILQKILEKTLARQVYGEKVKETALNCYMEDMYIGLLMQEHEKTLDEFCEAYSPDKMVAYLTEREDRTRKSSNLEAETS